MPEISEFAYVRFKVSDFDDGSPFIGTLEKGPSTNSLLDDKTDFIMLLKAGTSFEEALALKDRLNQLVERISLQR